EGATVARAARDHHAPGSRWSEQAVLVRTNAQAAVMSEAFTKARIPHRVRGAGDLMEQPEVRQAITTLRRASSLQMALGDLEEEVRRLLPGTDAAGPDSPSGSPTPGSPAGVPTLTEERAAN